jgi:hypothetical protein
VNADGPGEGTAAGDSQGGGPTGLTGRARKGRRPSLEDERWLAAGKELTPAKALERIDTKIGFVFSNITLVGTVLAGAGVLTGISGRLAGYELLTLTALGLIFLSLVCAMAGNLPSLRTSINPENIEEVKDFFTANISVRGWLTRLALLLFTAAFVIALIIVIQVAGRHDQPSLALQWKLTADGKRVVAASVNASALPPGTRAETLLVAVDKQGRQSTVFAKDVSFADASGAVKVAMEVDAAPAGTTFRLSTVLTDEGRRIRPEQVVELMP